MARRGRAPDGRPDWIGAVVEPPAPVAVDGMRGQQGALRFREPRGRKLVGLLWVGRVAADRVTVAYWCDAAGSDHCSGCYRRLLASIRWAPYDGR